MADQYVVEFCREWVDSKADRCNEPAVVILWGKLFPPEALGPRCWNDAAKWVDMARLGQWAVFDLRGLYRKAEVPA